MLYKIGGKILQLVKVSQNVRSEALKVGPEPLIWKEIDSGNTEWLKSTIKEIGWPNISKVGAEAAEAAWQIVIHADHDVAFQKECLALMKDEPENEVSEIHIAYLHDRIAVNEGQPQFFGTQFEPTNYGELRPRPIAAPDFVDDRRKEIGMETLGEFKRKLQEKFGL